MALHHRRVKDDSVNNQNDANTTDSSQTLLNLAPYITSPNAIPAAELLVLSPAKHGYIYKKSNSFLAYLFPCLFAKYQKRYLILVGAFIYRFKSLDSDSLKGIPIPLEAIIAVNKHEADISFEICTIRKRYIFRVDNIQDLNDWMQAIRERKQLSIRECMGHVSVDANILKANKKAERIFDKKLKDERRDGETVYSPFKDPVLS